MSKNQRKVGRFIVSPVEPGRGNPIVPPLSTHINEDSGYSSSSESDFNQPSPRPPSRETMLGPADAVQIGGEPWHSPYFKGESMGKSVASFALREREREETEESEVPISVLSTYQEAVCTRFSELLNLHRTVLLDIIEKDSNGEELIRSLSDDKAQLLIQLKRAKEEKQKLKAESRLRFPRS